MDKMDDRLESECFNKINFAKFLFISCWTVDNKESIPQWDLYGDNFNGVRIGLDDDMFYKKIVNTWDYPNRCYKGIKLLGDYPAKTLFSPEEVIADGYTISPLYFNRSLFFGKVKYYENIKELKESTESLFVDQVSVSIKVTNSVISNVVFSKDEHWSFQEECRFFLQITPSLPFNGKDYSDQEYAGDTVEYTMNCMLHGIPPRIEYIDLKLDITKLNEMELIIGPCVEEEEYNDIIRKINNYGLSLKIKKSILTNTIRKKT